MGMEGLREAMKTARSPPGLLTVKLGEIDRGEYVPRLGAEYIRLKEREAKEKEREAERKKREEDKANGKENDKDTDKAASNDVEEKTYGKWANGEHSAESKPLEKKEQTTEKNSGEPSHATADKKTASIQDRLAVSPNQGGRRRSRSRKQAGGYRPR